jgi:hypothetical protein
MNLGDTTHLGSIIFDSRNDLTKSSTNIGSLRPYSKLHNFGSVSSSKLTAHIVQLAVEHFLKTTSDILPAVLLLPVLVSLALKEPPGEVGF